MKTTSQKQGTLAVDFFRLGVQQSATLSSWYSVRLGQYHALVSSFDQTENPQAVTTWSEI